MPQCVAMGREGVGAVALVILMLLSGCTIGGDGTDGDEQPKQTEIVDVEMTGQWALDSDSPSVGDVVPITFSYALSPQGYDSSIQSTATLFTSSGASVQGVSEFSTDGKITLTFSPTAPGDYYAEVDFSFDEKVITLALPDSANNRFSFTVIASEQAAPTILTNGRHILEEPSMVRIQGTVEHAELSSCSMNWQSDDGQSESVQVSSSGSFSFILDMTEASESLMLNLTATCGTFDIRSSSKSVSIIMPDSASDSDGDGIEDDLDNCPNGVGSAEGWKSDASQDRDADGCRDLDEDLDDDNDLIPDSEDNCASVLGWISGSSDDHDQDGCEDATEDLDDDGDGVADLEDACALGATDWVSDLYTDWDSDGCRDTDEDMDDDQDGALDEDDSCPVGAVEWVRNDLTDYDDDGCQDSDEDTDDDEDGVADFNSTGAVLDRCPRTPLNATSVDEFGCSAVQRDSDEDGVNDLLDQCADSPAGVVVNSVGCADRDGDGVFANVDICPDTPSRWTVDVNGCTVAQYPVNFTSTSSALTKPLDTVRDWSVPTLSGTYDFQNEWTGEDVYLFLFKFTNSQGSSNSATWSTNPGTFIRGLPDNTQLFYGSFDSTYHNDVASRKSDVESRLSPTEEAKWMSRIHFIDMDASNIQGGLGDILSSFNNPAFVGIDRFQQARETGSIYAWTSQTNDPFHYTYEPHQWNAEYLPQMRIQDAGVEAITLFGEDWHSGGWSSGFSSFTNATVDLNNDLRDYDTLEIFHEHACEGRQNRYQKSDQSYGGCHEWDYEANLHICDVDNTSVCNKPFARWITTYGREGLWLTDISPYLARLDDGQDYRFRYAGANKGLMTVTLLFSAWEQSGSPVASESEFMFSGGQFDGSYNNKSKYKRDHTFTVPQGIEEVWIVASITGHGFNKDDANCAEFCDHEHHYTIGSQTTYEWHPIVHRSDGCEREVANGVVANQFGSWPFGRAGWCAGQDVLQWKYNITSWVDMTGQSSQTLEYRGLYNGQEYNPTGESGKGGRKVMAEIWLVYYDDQLP